MKHRITLVLLTLSLVLSCWPLFTGRAASGKTGAGQQVGNPFRLPAIAAGQFHSLALKSDGTIVAWGGNAYGQATAPTDLRDATAITADSKRNSELALAASAPTITPATGISLAAGSTTPRNLQIATATVGVTVIATAATGSGVTIQNIRVDSTGKVTADVTSTCGATTSTFTLRVTNSSGQFANATLTIIVTANAPPTLTYPANPSTTFGTALTVNSTAGPSDNGTVQSVTLRSISPSLSSGITVNSAGVVSVARTVPRGTYTVTVRAVDNCGATKDASFTITVK